MHSVVVGKELWAVTRQHVPQIRERVESGSLQLSLFDTPDMADFTHPRLTIGIGPSEVLDLLWGKKLEKGI